MKSGDAMLWSFHAVCNGLLVLIPQGHYCQYSFLQVFQGEVQLLVELESSVGGSSVAVPDSSVALSNGATTISGSSL